MTDGSKAEVSTSVLFVALLLLAILAGACDDPPTAPEPSVNIDEKQKALREQVDEVQSQAKERTGKVADEIPNDDTGAPEDAEPTD